MDLSNIIAKKKTYAKYVLKKDCGCDRADVESFEEHPGSFYGWLYITLTSVLLAIVLLFVGLPIVSAILIVFGLFVALMQFGAYKKLVDFLFPKKIGHNVTAIKICSKKSRIYARTSRSAPPAPRARSRPAFTWLKCTGEVKRRIIFNGHPDAAWEWPVNYKLGGVGFEAHAIIGGVGALYYLVLSIIACAKFGVISKIVDESSTMTTCALIGLIFVPFLIGLYFMWNKHRVVDGANDNLSGCYMGIAILKALQDEGIEFENTEIGVILSGSEEAGLRGAKAWCEAHKGEFDDVPTFIYSYDTIHDPKQLMTNYRDLNGTVKADKDVSDLFMECAEELGIFCKKGWVPPLGGATDSAAFAQAGFRATGITGLNHKLEDYYHTRRDTYDNMNLEGLANCFAVSVKVLEKFDGGAKQ